MFKRRISFVVVGVLVLGFGIVSLIGSDAPGTKKVPGEEPQLLTAITLGDFMNRLSEETRVEVMRILNENMPRSKNDTEERTIDFDSWLEKVFLDLQPVLTLRELNLLKKVLNVSPQGNGISTTSAICLKCGEATGLHKANRQTLHL